MLAGAPQAKMLKKFADRFRLEHDIRFYDVKIGQKRALYRFATPQRVRNRKLGRTFHRWEWKKPLGMKRRCDYVLLHGMPSAKWNVKDTIFVMPTTHLKRQVSNFRGQGEQISLDAVDATPNKRTEFYFSPKRKKDPAKFRAWLKKAGR
ncbi:MAG: hypothetical protein ABSB65_13065 [Candidatus Acidiferrales bacterium]|jgi:hypothetical protein